MASCGELKKHQVLVGFALETNNAIENAIDKLKKKNLDLIVLNSLEGAGAGFGVSTNKVTIIDEDINIFNFDLKPKSEVAQDILSAILKRLDA